MKLIVFSDSHGDVAAMEQCLRRERPDHILHLGDCLRDAEALETWRIPMTTVPGNCDWARDPSILTPEFEGVRIYMTHGHLHGVKTHYQRLLYAALEAEAQIALFGHTHVPECFYQRGLWVMNPGPCQKYGTYGIITLADGEITCRLQSVNQKGVS